MKHYLLYITVVGIALGACGQPAGPTAMDTTNGTQPIAPSTVEPGTRPSAQDSEPNATIVRSEPTSTQVGYVYQGRALPDSTPASSEPQPPPAWLLVGNSTTQGTPSSYELRQAIGQGQETVIHADGVPPQHIPDLATASISGDATATVVVGVPAATSFQALLHPWTSEPMLLGYLTDPAQGRVVPAKEQADTNVTGFVLDPLGEVHDQLLVVAITFPAGKAMYFWRLNPATTSAQTTPGTGGALAADDSPLANTSWKLEAFGPADQLQPPVANSEITITFDGAEYIARGNSGCNHYGGTYVVSDTTLTFKDLASTAMACESAEVMEQEQRFQQLLVAVKNYRLAGEQLELSDDAGNLLRWVAAES